MHRADAHLQVPGHDAELRVVRHGHFGRPLLAFSCEGGSAADFEGRGLLDAIRPLVDDGRVSVFAVDSLDRWTWSANDVPTEERANRHGAYQAWIEQAVVPWIAEQTGGELDLITFGPSLGAYHAVQFAFQRADIATLAMGFSGNYDPTSWNSWGDFGDATYFANPTAYVPGLDGDHLEWLRARLSVLLVVGEGPFETTPTGSLPSTRAFADLLAQKGIRHELDVWGHDSAHDWPWWQKQLAHHLPRFV
ncbi:hypothetical protein N802_02105 [Knoellia sinensis KCTC 19936]|uniref:Esterase n=1 Tax=Knoellia sinensis KCTC 19936 TaxID=1385520 RepID=A0A0A0JGV2_9MICO|nr:alpha/beta hydrolase-fold protein [Knoellia sinensis]KGN34856.1 hypothetical protein N802_02105 [Knoellia sinensis KCTC 19936]